MKSSSNPLPISWPTTTKPIFHKILVKDIPTDNTSKI